MDQAFAALEKAVWGCPWELTDNFVSAMREGRGRLTLSGPGDPTGRGLGFSFWRDERKVFWVQRCIPSLASSYVSYRYSCWLSSWHASHRSTCAYAEHAGGPVLSQEGRRADHRHKLGPAQAEHEGVTADSHRIWRDRDGDQWCAQHLMALSDILWLQRHED